MLRRLINKFGTTVYAQIWENRLKLTDIATGKVFEENPLVAIESDDKGGLTVISVGDAAAAEVGKSVRVTNPFSHPRVLFLTSSSGKNYLNMDYSNCLGIDCFVPLRLYCSTQWRKRKEGLR